MALAPGARMGPYQITAQIGAGGPAFVRRIAHGELRRGLVEAKERPR